MLRILLVTDEMLIGGVPKHVVDLANGLHEKNIFVIVASTDGSSRSKLHPDIPFIELHLLKANSYKKDIIGTLLTILRLQSIITHYNINIVHTHKRFSDAIGRLLALRNNIYHVSTCHNYFADNKIISFFGYTTIACSELIHQNIKQRYLSKSVKTVYNGIKPFKRFNSTEIRPVKNKYNISPDHTIISSIGHLSLSKDRITLLRAISLVKDKEYFKNIVFIIVGEGEQLNMLQKLAHELEIEIFIRFFPSDTNVEEIINISEFMVLSSVQEGLPFVLLEAASIGKCHVATNVGGVSEFVKNDSTGILVEPKNPQSLADGIEKLCLNPDLALLYGKNAQLLYSRQFTYDQFIDDTVKIYNSTFNNK
ncbi:MAG: glycosyltransferase family 4 protein [Bacteroidota bacterium]|nr:glycosyltransferase family 4 protein [Bacteroidota bacterium]